MFVKIPRIPKSKIPSRDRVKSITFSERLAMPEKLSLALDALSILRHIRFDHKQSRHMV